jgi:hypothetical protein
MQENMEDDPPPLIVRWCPGQIPYDPDGAGSRSFSMTPITAAWKRIHSIVSDPLPDEEIVEKT